MIVAHWPSMPPSPAKFSSDFNKPVKAFLSSSLVNSTFSFKASSKYYCTRNEHPNEVSPEEGFSVLRPDIPWDKGSIWSTMALYLFGLHIPLSFGGLSVVAQILHQPVLDSQTEALTILALQTSELVGVLLLLKYTAKLHYKIFISKVNQLSKKRNWLLASAVGFGFLIMLVFLTSLLADRLVGPKAVNNPMLKRILLSSNVSEIACIIVYCIVTPLLEETVYRGFLLTSLASTMKWHQAIIISSAIFSAAHFSDFFDNHLFSDSKPWPE